MVSTVSIIETIDPRLEMTMHLRGRPVSGEHVIDVELYYDPDPEEADEDGEELKLQERKIIDSSRQHFVIDPE